MAVVTQWVDNWRGNFEASVSYPNGGQATINLLGRTQRHGTGTLVTSTYWCKLGTSSGGEQYGTISGSLSKSGWTSSNQIRQFASKAITVNRTHSTQTFYYYGTFRIHWSDNYSNWYKTGALAVSVAPKSSYGVYFNANGGTGAPGTQTKWYGETLYIPATIPTKSGYKFMGWSTSSTSEAIAYQPGSAYTANSGVTLYAVWKSLISTKVEGSWLSGTPLVKVSGIWKEAEKIWAKVNGEWKEM